MDLYLTAYDKKSNLLCKKWIETDSLLEINNYIKKNHSIDSDLYFPLLNNSDMSKLRNVGKAVLLFKKEAYYLLADVNNENNKGILRDIIITEILD